MRFFRFTTLCGLAVLLLVTGCDSSAELEPPPDAEGGPLFNRYVALGNSITAGFQADGIYEALQRESYAVLAAQAMGTEFDIPAFNFPGCPPPFTNILQGERLGGGEVTRGTCLLREEPPRTLNNVAVPGAQTEAAVSNDDGTGVSALTTLILGGRTQVEAALDARPTFVTVWLGNNDVLGPALSGNPGAATPVEDFQAQYDEALDRLAAGGVEGGVLFSVIDVTLVPNLSLGGVYAQLKAQNLLPPTFNVDANCTAPPGAGSLIPFSYGIGTLLSQAQAGTEVTLDCRAPDEILTAEEAAQVSQTVAAYNASIEQQAEARGWGYVDMNPALAARKEAGEIPLFPNLPAGPDWDPGTLFGALFSQDGVHPAGAAHRIVADALIAEINATYGTDL